MSLEAEQAVVAACIESAAAYDLAVALTPADFSDPAMALLFELVAKMRKAGHEPDAITMAPRLAASARWASLSMQDPLAYIDMLVGCAGSFRHVSHYVEMIRSAAASRKMLSYCTRVAELAHDASMSAEEKYRAMAEALPALEADSVDGFVSYREAMSEAVALIKRRLEGEVSGLTSGFANIDRMTGGWEPGTLSIFAGRPSHGKSVYAMDFAHAAARTGRGPVLVFSLEMTSANVAMRGIASLGPVDYGELRGAKVDSHMELMMGAAIRAGRDLPIYIDDRGGISVDELRARARTMARREKPCLIVADYLTLLSGAGNNRTEQVGYVSRSLKAMAKELDVPVICLAQLNRGVDARTDKRPTLSDLRDSGEIEQDADIVMFTYLHEKYDESTPRKGFGEVIFAKQRNGETGSVFCQWEGRYQRFRSYDGVVPPMKAGETEASGAPIWEPAL